MGRSVDDQILRVLAANGAAFDEFVAWLEQRIAVEQVVLNELACAALGDEKLLPRARIYAGRVEMLRDLVVEFRKYKNRSDV